MSPIFRVNSNIRPQWPHATSEWVSDWDSGEVEVVDQDHCCSNRGDFDHDGDIDVYDLVALNLYVNFDGAWPGVGWKQMLTMTTT